jgi:hypothetical protein
MFAKSRLTRLLRGFATEVAGASIGFSLLALLATRVNPDISMPSVAEMVAGSVIIVVFGNAAVYGTRYAVSGLYRLVVLPWRLLRERRERAFQRAVEELRP